MGGLGHDASHFAVCKSPWINHIGTILGMWFLVSPPLWYHQHVYAHHSHTNVGGADPDLHHHPLFRLSSKTKRLGVHRLQRMRIYTYMLWGGQAAGDALIVPAKSLYTRTISGITPIFGHGETTLGGTPYTCATLFHNVLYLVIVFSPCVTLDFRQGVACALTQIAVSGWLYAFFTQINHLNDASHEGAAAHYENGKPRAWSVRQVESASNFAMHSTFWTYLSNGLNFQIEHHLFPGVNHQHLHIIAPIIQSTCREYGVRYNAQPSFWSALTATAEFYTRMS
jgi:fatty acid desaturase